jgi:hypothetical protein
MADSTNATLSKLAAAIGSRSGLDDLKALFNELDVDRSGELDLKEFGVALRRFGVGRDALDDTCVRYIFDAIDTSHNGTIDFDEFSQIAKCELELLDLNEHLQDMGVDAAAAEQAAAAVKSGVRINRTASTLFDIKMQGDLIMLSTEMQEKRDALSREPALQDFVRGWWNSMTCKDSRGNMDYESYTVLSVCLHKYFVPSVSDEVALEAVEGDWADDCPKGQKTMEFGKLKTYLLRNVCACYRIYISFPPTPPHPTPPPHCRALLQGCIPAL